MAKTNIIKVTQVKSGIGRKQDQRATLRALGLRRLNQTVEKPDTPEVRGMIYKVRHLVAVDES
jgi:large subunit ribosomal protein L30